MLDDKIIEVENDKGQTFKLSILECLDRFGTLPLGVHQRVRGTKPKVKKSELSAKRKRERKAKKAGR